MLPIWGSSWQGQLKSIFDAFPASDRCKNCWKASPLTSEAYYIVFKASEFGISKVYTQGITFLWQGELPFYVASKPCRNFAPLAMLCMLCARTAPYCGASLNQSNDWLLTRSLGRLAKSAHPACVRKKASKESTTVDSGSSDAIASTPLLGSRTTAHCGQRLRKSNIVTVQKA